MGTLARNVFIITLEFDIITKVHLGPYHLGRPYHFKFFKGCLPQILLGPFLNTLSHL